MAQAFQPASLSIARTDRPASPPHVSERLATATGALDQRLLADLELRDMKRPEILLVNPWIYDFAAYDLWARPMGLLVLATRLRREGWEPKLLDCMDRDHPAMATPKLRPHAHGRFHRTPVPKPEPLKEIPRQYSRYGVDPEIIERDLLCALAPKAVLVTGLMTYWYPGVTEAIRMIRKAFPGVPVILGGVYASLMPDHARRFSGADEVVVGPAESLITGALSRLTGITPASTAPSLAPEFAPALDLLRRVRFLPVLTSRGCPYDCAYCASGLVSPGFVRRDPEEVVREVLSSHLRYGVVDIVFYDDALLVNAERYAVPMLEALAARLPGLRLHSPNGLHASAITPAVAFAMKRAGFENIRIGFETASDDFHSRTGGKTSMDSFLRAVRNLRAVGFSREQIGAYLLVGMPGHSAAQVEDDLDRVLTAGAHPRLAEYSPIPGTRMWPQAVRASRYPLEAEPLFHNCTLLPAAESDVDWQFLRRARRRWGQA